MLNAVPVTANYLFDIGFERDEHTEKQRIRTKSKKMKRRSLEFCYKTTRSETLSKMPVK